MTFVPTEKADVLIDGPEGTLFFVPSGAAGQQEQSSHGNNSGRSPRSKRWFCCTFYRPSNPGTAG